LGEGFDINDMPPKTRPANMSQRNYKKWKKAYRERVEALGHQLASMGFPTKGAAEDTDFDPYGFTKEERLIMAQEGWTDRDIDQLFEANVAPSEMVILAKAEMDPQDIFYLISQGSSIEDIVDDAQQCVDDFAHVGSIGRRTYAE
jgi:hypothetical protein